MKRALVTTTINVPLLLNDYIADFKKHDQDVDIFVAGDRKTPPEARDFVQSIGGQYLGSVEQEEIMSFHPAFNAVLPWNCIQRRNVAILEAYRRGAEIIYTIDDDNFLYTENYVGAHGELGTEKDCITIDNPTGWANVCNALVSAVPFYHRGHSFVARQAKTDVRVKSTVNKVRVVVNAGLWLGDPDVDASARIVCPPTSTAYKFKENFVLERGTKAPFNSQNTALYRDVIPAYCMVPGIGRYDDIVASYIVKRIADHLGDYISYGLPLVTQKRNDHDLFKDLEQEMTGMKIIDRFVGWLYAVELKGKTYKDCARELMFSLCACADRGDITIEQRVFITAITRAYYAWLECFE